MENAINLSRVFPYPREEIFRFFVEPELLEQWSYPEGMTLKVPRLEQKTGGKYRFEHTSQEGTFVCNGYFRDFVPNARLIQEDHVLGPDGNMMFDKLTASTTFTDDENGTRVDIYQHGFSDMQSAQECENAWNYCLDRLTELLGKKLGVQRGAPEFRSPHPGV